MDYSQRSLALHEQYRGKMGITSLVPLDTKDDLSIAYTPGVGAPCQEIARERERVWDLTIKSHTIAVISDGSAVLGFGNLGPEAALPVMEGKSILYKRFAGLDAFPLCIRVDDVDAFVHVVRALEPTFGAIHLEDIEAPRCFEVMERLEKELSVPVMHDDRHGTAVVALAGVLNALRVVGKRIEDVRVVISGAAAAGITVAELLLDAGVQRMSVVDSQGTLVDDGSRNRYKAALARRINPEGVAHTLQETLVGADVFIGLSRAGLLRADDIATMASRPIVFAMANPVPEIMPDEALRGGAAVVATGRSDFSNQVNNVMAYPGLFLGILECRASRFTHAMYIAAAHALAGLVGDPTADRLFPSLFDVDSARVVADAVKRVHGVV